MAKEPSRSAKKPKLPYQLTNFIGRDRELTQIAQLLEKSRLVTLMGAGGIGKTRLAIQISELVANNFSEGVCFVELAPLSEPHLLIETIVQALAIKEISGQLLIEILINFLQDARVLLVLDNCEHLIAECAQLSGRLLANCPNLQILATSREALGIGGEVTLRIPSLATPSSENKLEPAELLQYDAVQLFVERSQAVAPDFALTGSNGRLVAHICTRLDGIPLALELAAARVRSLSMAQLNSRLDDCFRILTGGSRTALPRQQTLQAALDWSYDLLDAPEKVMLRRLAVFAGNWTLEAAGAICKGEYTAQGESGFIEEEVGLELVLQLVDKSLVQFERQEGSYHLLETVRQYARQKLVEAGEAEKYFGQHREWFLQLAEEANAHLKGPEQISWISKLAQAQDNLRVALDWSLAQGEVKEAARLAIALWEFWYTHINFEAVRWLEQIHLQTQEKPLAVELHAVLLNRLGEANHTLGGNFERATLFHQQALELWQQLGDKKGIVTALRDMGWRNIMQMRLPEAVGYAEECLRLAEELGDRWTLASALYLKGFALSLSGQYQNTTPLVERCLNIWRELGDDSSVASALGLRAQVEILQQNFEKAKPWVAEALTFQLKLGSQLGISVLVNALAEIAANAKSQPEGSIRAAQLMAMSGTWFQSNLGNTPQVVISILAKISAAIKKHLDEESFNRELEAGKKLTHDEFLKMSAAVLELEVDKKAAKPQVEISGENYSDGLTRREIEILRLVAAGLSNPQIAEKLSLSRRTVEVHVHSIFGKIEVSSRAAATRYAIEHGLT